MSLRDTQREFWQLCTTPSPSPVRIDELFVGSEALSAAARVDIYRNMYHWRLIDALAEDFPALKAGVGDQWEQLATDYVHAWPSTHPSLSRLGVSLPTFVAARFAERPALAELARLEWTRADVFEFPDIEPVGSEALVALGEALPAARLQLAPALVTLELAWDVLPLWRAVDAGESLPAAPRRLSQTVAVWKKQHVVHHAALALVDAQALAAARAGKTIAELCELFSDTEDPAQAAFAVLGSWLADGWIVDVSARVD